MHFQNSLSVHLHQMGLHDKKKLVTQSAHMFSCILFRRRESWDGWLAAVWGGRGGMGKKKGKKKEKQRKRVSAESVYTGFYRWNHRRTRSVGIPVGDSAGGSATSLHGYPGLNPSVFPSVKSSEKIHVIMPLQLSKKGVLAVGETVSIYQRIYRLVNTDKF